MKIKLLKIMDRLVGIFATVCLPLAPVRPFPILKRLLIIRPGGIGDAVLLAPVISCIKYLYPNSCITILAEIRNCGVFSLMHGVNKVFCYDHPGEFIQALLGRYDVVIDTEQWYRLSAVVARFVSAPVKIGFDTNGRRRMFTHTIRYDQHVYEMDNFFSLLKPLGIDCTRSAETKTLLLPTQSVSNTHQLLQSLVSESFITIFPGASISERRWGADRFRSVAEALSAFGVNIVVVGGKEDRQQGEVIAGGGLGLNLVGLTSLAETAAIIQKSSLLVSGDSGLLHMAVVFDVPTVSLFGPGQAKKWAPRGGRHIVINKGLPCSPCTVFGNTPPCPHHIRCMCDITVDDVVNAIISLLEPVPK